MNHDHNNTKHLLIMLACCLIPIALILAVSVFGISLGALTPLLPFALVLLCPVLMFFMMRGMGHGQDGEHEHHQADSPRVIAPSSGATRATTAESNRERGH